MNNINNRFKDLVWVPTSEEYTIVGGAGGISSWLILFLARAGFIPLVYDFDTVERHNVGGQCFNLASIDKLKTEAIKEIVYSFTSVNISIISEKFTISSMGHKYMFSGFDNMQARKDMFTVWSEYVDGFHVGNKKECIFIDGRLLAEQFQIFCVTGDNEINRQQYKDEFLFDDADVPDVACTARQTTHVATMISSFMTGFFTNFISNVKLGNSARAVPFKTEYFLPLNMME